MSEVAEWLQKYEKAKSSFKLAQSELSAARFHLANCVLEEAGVLCVKPGDDPLYASLGDRLIIITGCPAGGHKVELSHPYEID